jgi:ubiquitin carboxyl-terminal hydrolase 34
MLQVSVPTSQIESPHGLDPEYDRALVRYFNPYHTLVDFMVRLAVNEDNLSKMLVDLSAMVGLEGVPLHMQLFPKLWLDIFNTEVRRKGNYNLYLTLSQTTSKMLLM